MSKKYGAVNSQESAVALSVFPEKKKRWIDSILSNIHLVTSVIPLSRISLIKKRETYINAQHPKEKCWYIYFIGVKKDSKRNGHGKALLQQIMESAAKEGRTIILETSNPESLQFYLHLGFEVYHEWKWDQVDFILWFLKKKSYENFPQ